VATAANYSPIERAEREKTVVHIRSTANQAAAESIVGRLKVGTVLVSDQFADAITVVLGNDLK
jgi:hypothetical protein